jgi:hypothetical protein
MAMHKNESGCLASETSNSPSGEDAISTALMMAALLSYALFGILVFTAMVGS